MPLGKFISRARSYIGVSKVYTQCESIFEKNINVIIYMVFLCNGTILATASRTLAAAEMVQPGRDMNLKLNLKGFLP